MTEGPMAAAFLAVIGGASLLAVTARRLHANDDLPSLGGWALADRSLGTVWTWLRLGGTIFTAYTFAAVPGLVYGNGAPAFFALPYTVIVCPLAFVLLPRMWSVARDHGYVTAADFVRGRYGSAPLALVVALTGILATMPYLALQLLGIRAVLTAGGLPAVAIGLFTRRLHHRALLAGWAAGMVFGTVMVVRGGFSPVVPLGLPGHSPEIYAGLAALILNLAVALAGTAVLDRIGTPRGTDSTTLPPGPTVRNRPGTGASSA
ncbi:hypothetical protein [Streptomyces sp. NPDC019890]|uniref:sodium:solute symporter family transporter n=1 Tax=Streptomyces sp. NPDC019890 TaxID=3365064 RepID=UPI00384DF416